MNTRHGYRVFIHTPYEPLHIKTCGS